MGWFDFWDGLFEGNSAGAADRAMAAKYAKLAETLKQKKEYIETEREEAKTKLEYLYTKYVSNADSAEGKIITDFDTHVANWQDAYQAILNEITGGLIALHLRIGTATSLQQEYEASAAMKEAAEAGNYDK